MRKVRMLRPVQFVFPERDALITYWEEIEKLQKKWDKERNMPIWEKQWIVPNSRNTGNYTVSRATDGSFGCSCPAWTKNSARPDCKHILAIKLAMKEDEIKGIKNNYGIVDELDITAPTKTKTTKATSKPKTRKFDFSEF